MKHSTFRPNALPSGHYTIGQYVSERKNSQRFRKNGRLRSVVGDLCDFCKNPIFIRRFVLRLRIRGYRFICPACLTKQGGRKGTHTDYNFLVENKLSLGFLTNNFQSNESSSSIDSSMLTRKELIPSQKQSHNEQKVDVNHCDICGCEEGMPHKEELHRKKLKSIAKQNYD